MSDKSPVKPNASHMLMEPHTALAAVKNMAHISPKLLEMLATAIPPEKITEKVAYLLDATTPIRRDKDGNEYGGDIDNRAVEAGLKFWFSYVVGLPVQRVHTIQENIETDSQTFARLKESPAALALMLGKLGVPADVIRKMTSDQPVIEAETLGESSKE